MKKIFLISVLLIFSLTTFSQISKGKNTAGISLYLSSANTKYSTGGNTSKLTYGSIGVYYGHLVSDKLELGLGITDGYQSLKNDDPSVSASNELTSNMISFAPYLKCYTKLNEHFYFYLMVAPLVGFGTGKSTGTSGVSFNENKNNTSSIGGSVDAGFAYLFSEHWSINANIANLGVTQLTTKDKTTNVKTTTTNISLSGAFAGALYIGASYYF